MNFHKEIIEFLLVPVIFKDNFTSCILSDIRYTRILCFNFIQYSKLSLGQFQETIIFFCKGLESNRMAYGCSEVDNIAWFRKEPEDFPFIDGAYGRLKVGMAGENNPDGIRIFLSHMSQEF